jgi:CDP-diglyceride synthetase
MFKKCKGRLLNRLYSILKMSALVPVMVFIFLFAVIVPGFVLVLSLSALILALSSGLSMESLCDFFLVVPPSENYLLIAVVAMASFISCNLFCFFIQRLNGAREENVSSGVVNHEVV